MWRQLLPAFAAGACMPLAFAPFSLWPLVILSPAVLIYQMALFPARNSMFWICWVYGLGYFGFGVYWVYNSLHIYGHAPVLVAGGLSLLLIASIAVFIGLLGMVFQRLKQRLGLIMALWSIPILWFGMEWFKGWVLTGFPWLSVGYAHISSPLAGFAPVVGVFGISALSILLSSALIIGWVSKRWVAPAVTIVLVFMIGFALNEQVWTEASGDPVSVTMVQGNIPQEMKWRRQDRQKILDTYWNASLPHWDSDLVVWPEAAIPGRSEELQADVLTPMAMHVSANNSNLLTGIIVSDQLKNEYYNSMILMGSSEGVYHKRHLVPFGEYYPFRSLLAFMESYIQIPMSDMSSGPDEQELMSINGVSFGVSICYEDVFSRDINLDLPQANILINTSNDAWFGDSLAPHQHLEIAQMRSLETERPMVRSTNTGQSAFIDYRGRIIDATDQFRAQTLTYDLQGRIGSTPFLTFASMQPWLAWLILLCALFVAYRPAPKTA
jgi:apolipoprotein N-acyltransferase